MGIVASMILTYSWFKFTDTLLFTMCVVACIQTSNVEVLDPGGSTLPRMDVSLCRKVFDYAVPTPCFLP